MRKLRSAPQPGAREQGVRSQWADVFDGLWVTGVAAARAGVDPATLQAAGDAGEVIVLLDTHGQRLYPGCQFKYGWPKPSLIAAWEPIAAASSAWTACAWLVSADESFDGRSPLDYAQDGSTARLLTVSGQDAARLAQ